MANTTTRMMIIPMKVDLQHGYCDFGPFCFSKELGGGGGGFLLLSGCLWGIRLYSLPILRIACMNFSPFESSQPSLKWICCLNIYWNAIRLFKYAFIFVTLLVFQMPVMITMTPTTPIVSTKQTITGILTPEASTPTHWPRCWVAINELPGGLSHRYIHVLSILNLLIWSDLIQPIVSINWKSFVWSI